MVTEQSASVLQEAEFVRSEVLHVCHCAVTWHGCPIWSYELSVDSHGSSYSTRLPVDTYSSSMLPIVESPRARSVGSLIYAFAVCNNNNSELVSDGLAYIT